MLNAFCSNFIAKLCPGSISRTLFRRLTASNIPSWWYETNPRTKIVFASEPIQLAIFLFNKKAQKINHYNYLYTERSGQYHLHRNGRVLPCIPCVIIWTSHILVRLSDLRPNGLLALQLFLVAVLRKCDLLYCSNHVIWCHHHRQRLHHHLQDR